jgi:hypothetical protein
VCSSDLEEYMNEYNKGNVITKVNVEYILDSYKENGKSYHYSDGRLKLKINESNEINIQTIKDSWNRNEHCTDMQYYMEYCLNKGYVTPMKWLDELKHY